MIPHNYNKINLLDKFLIYGFLGSCIYLGSVLYKRSHAQSIAHTTTNNNNNNNNNNQSVEAINIDNKEEKNKINISKKSKLSIDDYIDDQLLDYLKRNKKLPAETLFKQYTLKYWIEKLPNPKNKEYKFSPENESETTLLARCLFAEIRGQGWQPKYDVAWTILKRSQENKWYGRGSRTCYKGIKDNCIHAVILNKYQFSWLNFLYNGKNPDKNTTTSCDPYNAWKGKQEWIACYLVSRDVLRKNKKVWRPLVMRNHYHTMKKDPAWAKGRKPVIVRTLRKGPALKIYSIK